MIWAVGIFVGVVMLLVINSVAQSISAKKEKDFEDYVLDSSDDEGRPRVHQTFEEWKERK